MKCVWGARTLEYLGHEIGLGKVEVPEVRVKALTSFKRPVNKKDLRAFLGTVGYYRRFIPDYTLWACSLNNALCKKSSHIIQWDDKMLSNFEYLISVLCSDRVLWLPRDDDHFTLHTDAHTKELAECGQQSEMG